MAPCIRMIYKDLNPTHIKTHFEVYHLLFFFLIEGMGWSFCIENVDSYGGAVPASNKRGNHCKNRNRRRSREQLHTPRRLKSGRCVLCIHLSLFPSGIYRVRECCCLQCGFPRNRKSSDRQRRQKSSSAISIPTSIVMCHADNGCAAPAPSFTSYANALRWPHPCRKEKATPESNR